MRARLEQALQRLLSRGRAVSQLGRAVRRGEVLPTWRLVTMGTIACRMVLWALVLGMFWRTTPVLVPTWSGPALSLLFLPAAILSIRVIAQGLQMAALPPVGLISLAAATDIVVALSVYLGGGLDPFPGLLLSVGVLALHGPLLPMWLSVGLAFGVSAGVMGMQLVATAQAKTEVLAFSITGLASTLLGLGIVIGVFGTWLRRLALLELRREQQLESVGRRADLLQTELPIACLWFDEAGQVRRVEGGLEPAAGSWALMIGGETGAAPSLASVLRQPPSGNEPPRQGELVWPADGRTMPTQVVSWTLSTYPLRAPDPTGETLASLAELGTRTHLARAWRWFLVLQDRTPSARESQLRTALQHAQDTAWLSAGLAHELRTPLGIIQTCAEQLALEGHEAPTGEDRERLRELLHHEITRLSGYVGDVLAYARLPEQAGRRQTVREVLERTMARLTAQPAGPGGPLVLVSDGDDGPAVAPEPLELALVNLLANAQQHSPPGIPIRCVSEAVVQDDRWMIRIIDGGPGIPQDLAQRLLRPYASTRPGGTGLGLPLAARAVGLLGGELRFEARPGGHRGMDPCILLPCQPLHGPPLRGVAPPVFSSPG